MRIRHAVVTAAGPDQRSLPLQRLIDRDGVEKSALRIVVEEAASGGVETIVVVHHRFDGDSYAKAAGDPGPRLRFVEQREPRGYGDALLAAREHVGDEPFLHLVGDHLYLRRPPARDATHDPARGAGAAESCARQVVEAAAAEKCSVSAVQPTREGLLTSFGAVGGPRLASRADAWTIDTVLEKPTPTEAEQKLVAPGLRAGHYLGFFGIHALTPAIFPLLEEEVARAGPGGKATLSAALARLCRQERHLALAVAGRRHDLGARYGVLVAQVALALAGGDRDEVMTRLLELVVQREPSEPAR
jgi:UTP--glucose-1-phosphate uridylyltransferase